MRLPLHFASILVLVVACGDDGGSSSESSDTSAGPSTGPDDSSSGGSVDSGSTGGSSEDSGSTSGVDSGSTGESGSSGGSSESGGSTGETGGAAFPCGDELECDLATQYCQEQISDIGGEPNTYQCLALPDGCGGVSSCDCLGDEPCGDFDLCEMTPEGGSILTVPAADRIGPGRP